MNMHPIVSIPIEVEDGPQWAGVSTVEYRDTINGVRFTAHMDHRSRWAWIVEHVPTDRNDTDGFGAYRSPVMFGWGSLDTAWAEVRAMKA